MLGTFGSRDALWYQEGQSLYRAYFAPNKVDPSGRRHFDCEDPGQPPPIGMNCPQFIQSIPTNDRIPRRYRELIDSLGPLISCGECGGGGTTWPTPDRCIICLGMSGPDGQLLYYHEQWWIGMLINGLDKCEQHVKDKLCKPNKDKPDLVGPLPPFPTPLPATIPNCRACLAGNVGPARNMCEYLYDGAGDRDKCVEAQECFACRGVCLGTGLKPAWDDGCPPFPDWRPSPGRRPR